MDVPCLFKNYSLINIVSQYFSHCTNTFYTRCITDCPVKMDIRIPRLWPNIIEPCQQISKKWHWSFRLVSPLHNVEIMFIQRTTIITSWVRRHHSLCNLTEFEAKNLSRRFQNERTSRTARVYLRNDFHRDCSVSFGFFLLLSLSPLLSGKIAVNIRASAPNVKVEFQSNNWKPPSRRGQKKLRTIRA